MVLIKTKCWQFRSAMWAIYVKTANTPLWVSDSRESLESQLEILNSHFGPEVYFLAAMID